MPQTRTFRGNHGVLELLFGNKNKDKRPPAEFRTLFYFDDNGAHSEMGD